MASLYERAAIIAGRSLTRSKAIFKKHSSGGFGAYVVDSDGHARIDMLCALGAVSLWNGDGVLSYSHKLEPVAGEMVLRHVAPWASSIRFLQDGSGATQAALRVAKAATGRPIVLMGDWAYHGQHEWSNDPEFPWTKRYPHGADLDVFTDGWADTIRAVFIEPHRWEPIDVEWLRSVREFCTRVGALMVVDDIVYGGRWALGGSVELFGVIPDLACYSKALWNGTDGSCIVGNEALAKHGEIVSGTFSGQPKSLQAVIDTLNVYINEPVIETMWARGKQLADGLESVLPRSFAIREGAPVHQRLQYARQEDGERFMREMEKRDATWHPLVSNIMYSHTSDHIERVLDAAEQSLKAIA